ncbi:MAG TPA: BON domain-containing protein [Gemmataceae bacterium]|nr:BON domain-containing protein [Gemmataceae bacterium]
MTTSSPVVLSRAASALRQSPIPSLRNLCVEETDTTVVIAGQVSSYYLKQLAQETVMPVLGRRELINRVNVVRTQAGQ